MAPALSGLDENLDRTAGETRRQAPLRAGIAALLFATGLTAIPLPALLAWLAMFMVGDGLLWIATQPGRLAARPRLWRPIRLAASNLSAWTWVTISALWWISPGAHGEAVAIALLAGVLLYVVRGCHRSMAQMLATGLPPLLALAVLPFTPGAGAGAGLITGVGLLAAYSISSGVNAWRDHRALEASNRALLEQRRAAEAANVAKSEFLANMSHEIRTPLNGVLAMANVLARSDLAPSDREVVRLICTSGEALERLVSEILDLAKVESGGLQLECAPFEAGAAVRDVAALFQTRAEAGGVALSVHVAPEADRAWLGDGHRVRQVLGNLVSNAIKFTPRGEVRLGLSLGPDRALRFSVADTGVGFDPALKARLFERFQQADGSITRSYGGSGLGLAISRGLAEAMGGELDCDSTPGEGSEFRFEVRLSPAAPAAPAAPAPAAAAAAGSGPLRVLAADDHPANRKVVEIILAGAGLEVTSVADGAEAVRTWRDQDFDLVLMDMQMPVMDGLAAVAEIRRAEAAAGAARTPILMLTANGLQEHLEAGRRAGADGHLTKPINPALLLQAIADAARAPAAGQPAAPEQALAIG